MCTVSWVHEDRGYQLFSNRDEKLTRGVATDPQLLCRDGVRFLAPIDGDFSGTWIAANEFGVSVCLLNGAAKSHRAADSHHRSRGQIVLDLASTKSLQEVQARLWQYDLSAYESFTLAVLERGQREVVMEWDGTERRLLPIGESYLPLVSSSFDPVAARNERRGQLAQMVHRSGALDPAVLLMFHQSHLPERGPDSPCMHRADAETVSFSWVTVTDSEVSFYYSAGSPCKTFTGDSFTLAVKQEERAECLVCC
jgi:hypothetical protein